MADKILKVATAKDINVKLLVNSASTLRYTPLYMAAQTGNEEIIKILLDKYIIYVALAFLLYNTYLTLQSNIILAMLTYCIILYIYTPEV